MSERAGQAGGRAGRQPGGMSSLYERIEDRGVIAIVRAASAEKAVGVGRQLIGMGLDVVEVSYNTPGAPGAIEQLAAVHPAALVGAGTVLRLEEAKSAAAAGARFLLSPVHSADVGRFADRSGLGYIPGVFTAAEVWACLRAGLDVLKLFPAGALGPAGMRALLEPFPGVRCVPTGGISVEGAAEWFACGALALGVGSSLTRAVDPSAAAAAVLEAASSRHQRA